MRLKSVDWRVVLGYLLSVLAFFGTIVGYYAWKVSQRQTLVERLESAGAEIIGADLADKKPGVAQANPGWYVHLAEQLNRVGGIGQPQRVVSSIRAEGDQFSDDDFKSIREVPEVRYLYLRGSRVTDDVLAGFAALQELRTIDLSYTVVSDEVLEHLDECSSLRKLIVNETKISRRAIREFMDQRGEVTVQWSPSSSQERREAIGAFLSAGGRLQYDRFFASDTRPATVIVRGRWTRTIDHESQTEILRKANEIPDLTSLSLQLIRLSENAIDVLKQFRQVRSLRLERVRTRDFSWLESMESLQSISISRMDSDAVLQHVAKLPNLRSVSADYVTDDGALHLGNAKKLESIWFRNSRVTDRAIARWSDLPNLNRLRLDSPNITNASLTSIGQIRALDLLSIERAQIDDRGLGPLQQLHRLRFLGLIETNVSTAAFSDLKLIRQLQTFRFVPREYGDERVNLLDYTINTFWDEFADESDEDISRMIVKYFRENPHPQEFALNGGSVNTNKPEAWIEELLVQLKPVIKFCRELPDCKLR